MTLNTAFKLFLLPVLMMAATSISAQILKDVSSEECIAGNCLDGEGTMELKTPWGPGQFRGNFRDGEFHGKGRLELPISFTHKTIYDGNWNLGIRDGKGTYWNGKGNLYMGEWKGNKRNGRGSYFFNLPRWEENKNSEMWLRENTENYSGEFLNDHYHGEGIFRWENGSRYEGTFFAGNKHGMGTYYYNTGNARQQIWEYGAFVR